MNTFLLGLVTKWVTLVVAVTGIMNGSMLSEETIVVNNINPTKNTITFVKEIKYKTETIYNDKLPKNTKITKNEGQPGLAYKDSQDNTIQVIKEPENKVIEIGTGKKGEYVGKMTSYGADCAGCSGTVSCSTKEGTWNLISNGTNYNDEEYGNVRILAAALSEFPCGTIIEVDNPNIGMFNAIVLDTGGAMRQAFNNGQILMDLAFVSETSEGVYDATSSNVKYNVKRWGW